MLELVYALRDYITEQVIPAVEEHGNGLVGQLNDLIDKMETTLAADREITGDLYREFTNGVNELVTFINNKTGPEGINRFTLTEDRVFIINPLWPTMHPIAIQIIQDSVGTRNLAFPAAVTSSNVIINTGPGAVTNFWLIPLPGGTWTALQNVSRVDVADLVEDVITPVKETADAALPANRRAVANGVASLDGGTLVPISQLPTLAKSGTYAARPAIALVKAGHTYYTVDTMETYVSTGTEWVTVGNGGSILGTAQTTYMVSTDSNTWVTDLNVPFKAGTRPVEISLSCDLAGTEEGGDVTAEVYLNDVMIMQLHHNISYPDRWETKQRSCVKTLVPGSSNKVIVKLVKTWGSTNNVKIGGSATEPALLIVRNG